MHSSAQNNIPNEDLTPSINLDVRVEKARGEEKLRIAFIGDSTVSSYDPQKTPMRGWGQVAPQFFNDHVSFFNNAWSGASTKSFLASNRWNEVKRFKPDYLFIQFGHNDQKNDPKRGTDHKTSFRDNLRTFIHEIREQGGTPILVTPVSRRTFNGETIRTSLQPWADAMKAVAEEENIAVIDLHATSKEFLESLGDEASTWINCCTPQDRTHFSESGAIAMFSLVSEEFKDKAPKLIEFLKEQRPSFPKE